jgi:hypothetical protein
MGADRQNTLLLMSSMLAGLFSELQYPLQERRPKNWLEYQSFNARLYGAFDEV